MLNNLSEYVRNIATFLVLISFIGIIMPNNKYKNYINLVIGFILIFIMISPISKFLSKGKYKIEDIFNDMELNMDKNIMAREYTLYEDKKRTMIIENYKERLHKQIKNIVNNKKFEIININIDISEKENNFGEILNINMLLESIKNKKSNKYKKEKILNIKVEKISSKEKSINKEINKDTQNNIEIKNLKNYLSDFYNLSLDNIHIKVEDKNL